MEAIIVMIIMTIMKIRNNSKSEHVVKKRQTKMVQKS